MKRVIDTNDVFQHQYAMKTLRKARVRKTLGRPGLVLAHFHESGGHSLRPPLCRAPGRSTSVADDPMHELAVMKKLNHPNIIRLKEVILDEEDNHKVYFIMEYLPYGTILQGLAPDEPLGAESVYIYMRDIIYGLEYCKFHSRVRPALR